MVVLCMSSSKLPDVNDDLLLGHDGSLTSWKCFLTMYAFVTSPVFGASCSCALMISPASVVSFCTARSHGTQCARSISSCDEAESRISRVVMKTCRHTRALA
eukprot:4032617-Prymnesium_polylepis.2